MDVGTRCQQEPAVTRAALALIAVFCCHTAVGQTSATLPAQLDSDGDYFLDESGPWISPSPPTPGDLTDLGSPTSETMGGRLARHRPLHARLGEPLTGTSWLNRPYYVGAFAGTWTGDTLIDGRAEQDSGFFGGYLLGADMSRHWGAELRASVFYVNTSLLAGSRMVESRNVVGDINLLYYPWGDSRWRPYASLGVGMGGYHFVDERNIAVNHTGLALPIGFGVKYLCRNWLAMRLDIKDNVVFGGNGLDATNNLSVVGGVEIHWGSNSSVRYFPW